MVPTEHGLFTGACEVFVGVVLLRTATLAPWRIATFKENIRLLGRMNMSRDARVSHARETLTERILIGTAGAYLIIIGLLTLILNWPS